MKEKVRGEGLTARSKIKFYNSRKTCGIYTLFDVIIALYRQCNAIALLGSAAALHLPALPCDGHPAYRPDKPRVSILRILVIISIGQRDLLTLLMFIG